MRSSRLAMALDTGALTRPDQGEVAVFGPRAGDDLSDLPRDRTVILTDMRVDHDAFAAQGWRVRRPDAGPYAAAIVCVPRARDAARAMIAAAVAAVPEGAAIAVDGQKTDGIDAILREVRSRVAVADALSKAHGKLFAFPAARVFDDWTSRPSVVAGGFVTRPGVFSADAPDAGSVLLGDALPAKIGARVVDLGAGWGFLARAILAREGVATLDLVESDAVALDCARQNVTDPRARFHWADATGFRPDHPADAVVMNPPFHLRRTADPGIGIAFLRAAARMLAPGGTLWLVANRTLPYLHVLPTLFHEVEEIGGSPAYRLIRASGPIRARPQR